MSVTDTPGTAVVPLTGEVLDLAALDDTALGGLLDQAAEYKRAIDGFQQQVGEEIHRRMDAEQQWTIRVPGYLLTGKSPDAHTEYPVDELRSVLGELIVENLIPADVLGKVIVPKVTYEVSKAAVNRLLKLGGEVEARVKAVKRPLARPRRVTVKQIGGR